MRRVLFVAYHYPPIGGAGVQRNVKFARYLPDFGWSPIVITGPGLPRERWTPIDPTMEAETPEGIEIHRLRDEPPVGSSAWRRKAGRWLARPDDAWQTWWTERAVALAESVGGQADVVYASLIPYETSAAAIEIARRLRKPLVVDLQDPWALDEMMIYPSVLHWRLELSRMRRALRGADAVVMNTPESARRVRSEFPELRGRLVVSITNGFDAADFEQAVIFPNDGVFRIVHTGYLHTELGLRHRRTNRVRRALGGSSHGVDILTRSHVFLLEAIDGLLRQDPALAEALEVHLAGVLTETDREIAARSPVVRIHGYLEHGETLGLIRTADLLFLPMHDMPAGHRIGITPGKTYEYVASGRPILAAVPDGDVRDLLTDAGTAYICRPADVAAMQRTVLEQLERQRRGEPGPQLNTAVASRFERRHLTEELVGVFDLVREASEPDPGATAQTKTRAASGRDGS